MSLTPSLANSRSRPGPPQSRSASGPPLSRSSPARPKTLSSPPRPNSRSAPRVPRIAAGRSEHSLRRRRSNRASERDQPDGCDPSPPSSPGRERHGARSEAALTRHAHAAHVPTPKHGLHDAERHPLHDGSPARRTHSYAPSRELGGILREDTGDHERASRPSLGAPTRSPCQYHLATSARPGFGSDPNRKCAYASGAGGRMASGGPPIVVLAQALLTTPSGGASSRTVSFWARSSVGLPAAVTSRTYRPGSRLRGSAIRLVKDPFVRTSPRATWMRFPRRNAS